MQQTIARELAKAVEHLSTKDKVLQQVIQKAGACTISPHNDYYNALVSSIIGQQLSVKAASSIRARFLTLFGDIFPTPFAILEKSIEELRTVGLSNAKARYIQDLAQHILDNKISFDHLTTQTNQEIITELTDVKGIGEWTAQIFLLFCVGRLDVLPTGDLGIRNGVRSLYNLSDVPTPQQVTDIATQNQWHPYESVASWYIWRSLDNKPTV